MTKDGFRRSMADAGRGRVVALPAMCQSDARFPAELSDAVASGRSPAFSKGVTLMAKKNAEVEVAVDEVVQYLRLTGEFIPALQAIRCRKLAALAAKKAGLKVTAGQLQKAADAWRVANGLIKASDTEAWLAANDLSVEALEAHLETNLLIEKLKDHLDKKTSKKKYLASKEIKEAVREMIYEDWLAKAMK